MKIIPSVIGAALAGLALGVSAPAAAQAEDLDPAMVAAASRYALPVAFEGYLSACNTKLARDGYINTNSSRIHAKFAEGSDAAWPSAKAAMLQMASKEAGDMTAMFEMMGDEALRPFVDGLIASMVSSEIKTENCADIERGLEILDPLPADNVAELIGFFVELAERDKKNEAGETAQ